MGTKKLYYSMGYSVVDLHGEDRLGVFEERKEGCATKDIVVGVEHPEYEEALFGEFEVVMLACNN